MYPIGIEIRVKGRVIAQAVSGRLPTAAAQVWAQVRPCGVCGWQSNIGASFLRVLRFPLPILIPLTAPHSSSIIRDWYNRPISGRRTKWTHKGMVRSDMSKPALIFFSTARVHTTTSTIKILAANTHWKYFLKIAEFTHFFLYAEPLVPEVCTILCAVSCLDRYNIRLGVLRVAYCSRLC
jgi:hypothetical protein